MSAALLKIEDQLHPFSGFEIDYEQRELSFHSADFQSQNVEKMTAVQFDVFTKLFQNHNSMCSKAFLHRHSNAQRLNTRSIDTHVSNINKALTRLFDGFDYTLAIQAGTSYGYQMRVIETGLDRKQFEFFLENSSLYLNHRAHKTLEVLCRNFNKSVTGREDDFPDSFTKTSLAKQVVQLRRAFEENGVRSVAIETANNFGYKLKPTLNSCNVRPLYFSNPKNYMITRAINQSPDLLPGQHKPVMV